MRIKNYIIILGMIVVPAILISMAFKYKWNSEITLSVVAGSISIGFGLLKISLDSDRMFYELFVSFNEKYDSNFNNLINELKMGNKQALIPKDRLLIIDYLNLCSEEYLWFKKGRLPKNVWKSWEEGIISNIQIEQVRRVYDSEMNDPMSRKSYYGFAEYIDKKLNV